MLRLEDHFWNPDVGDFSGWEVVVNHLKEGKHISKQYVESLKQRAQLEEAYGKNLMRLAKSIPPALDSSTFSSAWTSYRHQTESTAQAHLSAARRLTEEAQLFGDSISSSCERRAQEDVVRQWQQRLKIDTRRMTEAKALYEKKCKEEIVCNHLFHQEMARFGKLSKEAEKAKLKLEKSQLSLRASDGAYRAAVDEAEATRKSWEEKTKETLSNFQTLEEGRMSAMLESMWKVSNIVSCSCVEDDEAMEELRVDLEKCLETDCLDGFIRENATGTLKPKEIWYESQPTSTSLGLGPAAAAPTLSARVASSSSVASSRDTVGSPSPPKPPRLIHYASRSKEDWDRLARSGGSYPHVDSVDNIEYFNLPDPLSSSLLPEMTTVASGTMGSAENSGNESSSSSDIFWTLDSLVRR